MITLKLDDIVSKQGRYEEFRREEGARRRREAGREVLGVHVDENDIALSLGA